MNEPGEEIHRDLSSDSLAGLFLGKGNVSVDGGQSDVLEWLGPVLAADHLYISRLDAEGDPFDGTIDIAPLAGAVDDHTGLLGQGQINIAVKGFTLNYII